jgi:nucleotide-binding universal stress UspA family protein
MTDSGANRWTRPAVILVATDLSDLDRLMPFALEQAAQTGARLLLLHAIASSTSLSVDAVGMPYYDPSAALEFAEKSLKPWCQASRRRDIVCDGLVREGRAVQQIATVARQFNADRILLGTRSRSRLGKLLLGSVAEQVLRSVNLPVITVGPEAHLAVRSGYEEQLVLHATTLRETSRPSAALACQLAAGLNAKLVLLHVLPPIDEMQRDGLPTGLDSAALQELRALAAETAAGSGLGSQLEVEPMVVHGNPFIEILAEASARRACLIVLGASHRTAFENQTRDRTVYRVLAHARCPVLTLREPFETASEGRQEQVAALHG